MIRVADYIMKRIVQEDVKSLFYVPGGQCVYLMDALRREESLNGISVHHEQAAAMAALAYAHYNNHLGACLVTTGCAGTNTMTGVLHAWQDSIPCIFISGQQNIQHTTRASKLPLRQIGVQEADIVKLVSPITKYAVMLTDAEDVAYELDKAIYEATHGRKGPVWIDVPLGIQNSMVDEEKLRRYIPKEELKILSDEDENYIISCIEQAKRPVIFAGQGVRSADAKSELYNVAEKYHIPVVFTRLSVDLMEYDHPYNMGVVCSVSANRYANFIIQNSDLVLNVGCRLSIDTTGPEQKQFAREAKVIVIDIDEVEHQKDGVKIDRLVLADAKNALQKLYLADAKVTGDEWIDKCNHWKQIFPDYDSSVLDKNCLNYEVINIKYFLDRLSKKMPENTTLLADAGMTGAIVSANCHLKESDRMVHAYAQGEMGFVLPGSFGVARAVMDEEAVLNDIGTVVAITGDGSFMMNLQELQTLVRNQFNIKLIINNNNGYSGVRHGQKAHFRGKSIGTDSSNGLDFPDLSKISVAFGIRFVKIEKTSEIDDKIQELFCEEGPCICEVLCDPEQFDLHNALVMYGKRKFGFRPIEDQSPFIDRDIFFEEMIVEPMETSWGKPM